MVCGWIQSIHKVCENYVTNLMYVVSSGKKNSNFHKIFKVVCDLQHVKSHHLGDKLHQPPLISSWETARPAQPEW